MRRFFYLLKKIIFICIIAALGWYGYRYMNETEQERQLARGFLGTIHQVNHLQFRELLFSGKRNNRPAVIFIFKSDCLLCRWHFKDIQDIAKQYPRNKVNILMLSVDDDPMDTASLIYRKGGTQVPIMILNPPGKASIDALYGEMYRLGAKSFERDTYPYIAVANKAMHIEKVQFGWDRQNKLKGMLNRALGITQE